MRKTGFSGYVYDFSVDYDATDVDDIKNIHMYLMKKWYGMNTSSVIKNVYQAKEIINNNTKWEK